MKTALPATLNLTSAPVLILIAWLLVELAAIWLRRCRPAGKSEILSRVAAWSLRPWAVWAVFNCFCRITWAWGFNDPYTFPFYAGVWQPGIWAGTALLRLAVQPWILLATTVAAASAACMAAFAALALKAPSDATNHFRIAATALPLLTLVFWLAVNLLPLQPEPAQREPGSLLRPWHNPGSTLLYAMPLIDSTDSFIRNYPAIQPKLKITIHGLSHPPGAPLSLKLIGQIMRAGADIRQTKVKLRYLLGLVAIGALNSLVMIALGKTITGSSKVALLAATLWAVCPAATVYATFAHDIIYALFFNLLLLLIFRTQTAAQTRPLELALMGLGLFVLAMLTYSAVLIVAALGIFGLLTAWRAPTSTRLARYALRAGLPLALAGLCLLSLRLVYDFDYLAAYNVARAYVEKWYCFNNSYQWGLALIGGQLELLLMMGGVCAVLFLSAVRNIRRVRPMPLDILFLTVILALYLIPVLVGPSPLKMETSRCWHWVTSIPLILAARRLLEQPRAVVWSVGAVIATATTSLVLRLFLDFSL